MEMEAEKEVLESGKQMRTRRTLRLTDPMISEDDTRLASALNQQVLDGVYTILKVATKSKNLKGTYQRELKDAAAAIKEAVGVLKERSSSDESARLSKENERLKAGMAELRREIAELRADLSKLERRTSPPLPTLESMEYIPPVGRSRQESPPPRPPDMEDMMRIMMVQVGSMVNARLEGLEERLLPEKRLRPPLAGDKAKESAVAGPSAADTQKAKTKAKKGKKPKSMAAAEAAAEIATKGPQAASALQPVANAAEPAEWATVAKGGKKEKAKDAKGKKGSGRVTRAKKAPPKTAKLRPPPKTSAVVITLQPGAEERGYSYAKALLAAKSGINLAELGTGPLSLKLAMTGARMLIIQDDPENKKAELLARKMRECLNVENVRVTRPVKSAEIRISGLDDATTAAEVLAAVARVGECSTQELKAGEIRRARSGLGTIWVRCPVAAAKKVVAKGHLQVGWVSAAVKAMASKEMRCYRCLQSGHAAATCSSEVDRSRACYRCGEDGHKAAQCSVAPHCILCAAAEKPAAHRLWSKACTSSSKTKKTAATKKPRAPIPPARPGQAKPQQKAAEAMEV